MFTFFYIIGKYQGDISVMGITIATTQSTVDLVSFEETLSGPKFQCFS